MINTLLDGYDLLLSHNIHREETSRARTLHSEAIDEARKQHAMDINLVKQTYLLDVFMNLEQHFQQLNAGEFLS
jgi:hypothetical protein